MRLEGGLNPPWLLSQQRGQGSGLQSCVAPDSSLTSDAEDPTQPEKSAPVRAPVTDAVNGDLCVRLLAQRRAASAVSSGQLLPGSFRPAVPTDTNTSGRRPAQSCTWSFIDRPEGDPYPSSSGPSLSTCLLEAVSSFLSADRFIEQCQHREVRSMRARDTDRAKSDPCLLSVAPAFVHAGSLRGQRLEVLRGQRLEVLRGQKLEVLRGQRSLEDRG